MQLQIMVKNSFLFKGFILVIIFVGSIYGAVIDGGWSQWSVWSHCSTGYNPNYRVRARECINPEPSFNGLYCVGDQRQTKDCLSHIWSEWSAYTKCSATCGIGVKSRVRNCTTGDGCPGATSDIASCTQPQCVVDGGWTNFTDLPCSTTCGNGVAVSVRTCTNPAPANGGNNCTGLANTFRLCKNIECPIDGEWASWGAWGKCSVTSGVGVNTRTRSCTQPAPKYGGKDCDGNHIDTKYCVLNAWAEWSSWTSCDVTCGNGTKRRTRSCRTGNDCIGVTTDVSSCNNETCPQAGIYTEWSSWGECTATCGYGISTRTRTCNVTSGYSCSRAFLSRKDCKLRECPIDGAYGHWANWTECSVTCGTGLMFRKRVCDSPAAQNGGDCPGDFLDQKVCTMNGCVVDGGWSLFINQSCSVTCGRGFILGVRACTHPAPQNGGKDCVGPYTTASLCDEGPCPVDGGWSLFINQSCSETCGRGFILGVRACTHPAPQNGGKDCVGPYTTASLCDEGPCPVDGGWSQWSSFTPCKSICGDGFQVRNRSCNNPTPTGGGNDCLGYSDERTACNNGPCPPDIPTCNRTRVQKDLHDHSLYVTTMPTPCSNMNFIAQENMMRNVCHAPNDANKWLPSKDIRQLCDSIPQYSPLTIVHRDFNTTEYGIVIDCFKGRLQFATETCERGVHEVNVDIEHDNTNDYFTTTW